MQIGLLSRLAQRSQSYNRMVEAATLRGHQVVHISPYGGQIIYAVPGAPAQLVMAGQAIARPDVVITRVGSGSPPMMLHLVRHLEALGIVCLNTAASLDQTRDKARQLQTLARNGIPIPASVFMMPLKDPSHAYLDQALAALHGPPWVVKLLSGSEGRQVMLIETIASLRSILDTLETLEQPVIVQEFVREARGSDIRVIVVGGQALAAMRRTSKPGEFRSNVYFGGLPEPMKLVPPLRTLAERAATVFGLAFAGVDIVEGPDGYLVLEVNSSPGLNGIQAALDAASAAGAPPRTLAGEMIAFVEQR